ncbi:hypothetical protein ACQ4LE_002346 [Meloidogyne hapla]|uniref:ribose-5-phosphate isomerase n=1 Tax=Meloidogyne hapla TaxID=6305 RepID=A0A1I8BSB3_MELHA
MAFYLNERNIITESEDETSTITTIPTSANLKMIKIHNKNSFLDDLSPSDRAKKFAAAACGEAEVKSGMNLGIGSGTTMKFLIDWLHETIQNGHLKDVKCVPTSFQTRVWLTNANLPVYGLDQLNDLDLAIDGADEVDKDLNCIKGAGGCLLQEKVVQCCAKRFVVIGGLDKYSEAFGRVAKSIPIEIAPLSLVPVQKWITEKHGGKCILRMDSRKCFPVITENHNYLLDWHFPIPENNNFDWDGINQSLLCIPGVAETGLFLNVTKAAYFATPEGEIQKIFKK